MARNYSGILVRIIRLGLSIIKERRELRDNHVGPSSSADSRCLNFQLLAQ